jgi:hypothetical protein
MQLGINDIRGEKFLKCKTRMTGCQGNSNKCNYVRHKHHHLIMTTQAYIPRHLTPSKKREKRKKKQKQEGEKRA